MNFLKRFFGSKLTASQSDTPEPKDAEQVELAIDLLFLQEFKKNKGKFLYCTSDEEINQSFSVLNSPKNTGSSASSSRPKSLPPDGDHAKKQDDQN